MKLDVVRTQFGKDATNGMLFIDKVFEAFTLEDEVRDVKVHSETAIPLGEYLVVKVLPETQDQTDGLQLGCDLEIIGTQTYSCEQVLEKTI